MKWLRSTPVSRAMALFLYGITLFYLTACNSYKVTRYGTNGIAKVESIQSQKKILLHNGSDLFRVRSLTAKEWGAISMELAPAQIEEILDIKPNKYPNAPNATKGDTVITHELPSYYNPGKSNKLYSPKKQPSLTREVHFYLSTPIAGLQPGTVDIPSTAIGEIHIIERDPSRSTFNTILAAYFISQAVLGAALIIALATKGSCPYVFVYDGNQFTFQGEIFSGAVLQNLERHDYLPLPLMKAHKGEFRLRIANELKEKQSVNLAELIGVQHPVGTKVALDVQGAPQLIANPQLPLSALSANGIDQQAKLNPADQQAFAFDEKDAPKNSLTLSFPKAPGAKAAKLVLNAKNSLWFDQLYGRFAEKVGTAYPTLMKRLGAMTREERQQEQINQDFPLSVFLKTADGQWRLAGRMPLAGPLGWRDMALPIDLSQTAGETVELRLETGFLFWEIDYAALDYSDNAGMNLLTLQPKSAKDQDGQSQLAALRADDDLYLRQPQPGLHTELHFAAPEPPANRQMSYFLHTKGYYEHIRDFQNAPNLSEVQQFRQPHYFDLFSRAEYQRAMSVSWVDGSLK